jgi:hypothetical protein
MPSRPTTPSSVAQVLPSASMADVCIDCRAAPAVDAAGAAPGAPPRLCAPCRATRAAAAAAGFRQGQANPRGHRYRHGVFVDHSSFMLRAVPVNYAAREAQGDMLRAVLVNYAAREVEGQRRLAHPCVACRMAEGTLPHPDTPHGPANVFCAACRAAIDAARAAAGGGV